ncbi:MAG: anthranilate synthase component I family protein [Phycisphaerae bacterium]|nr:anthranilate synthase component I family protein [Phycisphaerae bacterium]MDP7637108.1 anthranilate synthase component I family protein [Phycisphaerae bacterium]
MHWTQATYQAEIITEPLDLDATPAALLDALADLHDPAMLDSAALHETYGRYSILACEPMDVLTLHQGTLRHRQGGVLAAGDDRAIWTALSDAFSAIQASPPDGGGDPRIDAALYAPGWIGYLAYELGRHVERLPGRAPRDTHLPDLHLAFYDSLLVYDAVAHDWSLRRLVFPGRHPFTSRAHQSLRQLADRARHRSPQAPPAPPDQADAAIRTAARDFRTNFTPAQYRRTIARCLRYITAGDIFQVNLSQRLTVPDAPPPPAIYHALRHRNPAYYGAYLAFEAGGRPCAVLSSSPELFMRVRGGHVITRPIKGTRPRIGDKLANARAAADLLASPKDNAELAMIIDLLRNDLGRVCRFGTIRVTEPRALETHPTVFHLAGTVEGDLRPGIGAAELLRATFPGGSITGAPKIRAMEIIDELEPQARGVYTGCIGHVGVDGACEWNIVIRTVVCDGPNAHVQVGGGIVADSTTTGEYQETLDKARAMLEAIAEARAIEASQVPGVIRELFELDRENKQHRSNRDKS